VARFIAVCAAAALAIIIGGPPRAEQRVVNFYNWSDYIAPAVIDAFTRETGIAVRYDTFDSSDILETKLLAGNSGYDVVVPTAYFLERDIEAGVFQKLDRALVPNLANVWKDIADRLARYDPGNAYAVNYMWGTTGIGFNIEKTTAILGPEHQLDSWKAIFDPQSIARFKACGIHMLDSPDDILTAALRYLDLDPNTNDPKALERAADTVVKVRPYVQKFHSSEYLNALASGEICLAVGFSGDIKQAAKRAREARNGVEIGYAIPEEGALLWFDNLAIPRDAPHVRDAHALIDYLLRPQVAAQNTNFIAYANSVLSSRPYIDKSILDDRGIYPDAATMERLYTIGARDHKTQRLITRLWTRIKTGI
jgi:putrescine transport system substrate-binding protein